MGGQRHGHTGYSANHIYVAGKRKPANRPPRGRKGNDAEVPSIHLAPPAGESFAKLEEVDRPIKVGLPFAGLNSRVAVVNLNQGTGRDEGVKREILHSDVAVQPFLDSDMLQEGQGNLAPGLDHSRQ